MIDVIKVAKAVKRLMNIADDDNFSIIPTVTVACTELSDRLKSPEYADDERVVNAAVFLSYYRMVIKQLISDDAGTSFKAGDITISQSPSLATEKAAALRDDALLSAAPLLSDMEFVFEQV